MLFCYDLSCCPPTFDAVAAACLFESERIKHRAPEMEIIISPGPKGGFRRDQLWPYGIEVREAMLNSVVIPIFNMLPTCRKVWRPDPNDPVWIEPMYGFGIVTHGLKRQINSGVRPLRARLEDWSRQPDLVTITLREASHWPSRNSNIKEWIKVAYTLKKLGLRVVFIRDTLCADLPLGNLLETSPEASRDLYARAGLYRSAHVNLGVNNGPMWLAAAMDEIGRAHV